MLCMLCALCMPPQAPCTPLDGMLGRQAPCLFLVRPAFLAAAVGPGSAATTLLCFNPSQPPPAVAVEILPEPPSSAVAGGGGSQQEQQQQPQQQQQATAAAPSPAGLPTVQLLSRLQLRLDEASWPMCLVAGEEALAQYNAVLVLFTQVCGGGLGCTVCVHAWKGWM